ncbi:hypothetical protein RJ639_026986 [Escallonia herrerae]|uniref:Transmembrane protein n=1 Tax=Escallonia herrerae TaxID=1293975 RepID=A0AA89BFR6_9ASTE|nr:hypothetical protein RJ639_026986 [Escallonia herrerae]
MFCAINMNTVVEYGAMFYVVKLVLMKTTSKRLADRKVERFEKNIKKRGAVPETTTKKGSSYPVGPIVLGFFIFVVIGSYNPYGNKWRHGLSRTRKGSLTPLTCGDNGNSEILTAKLIPGLVFAR